MVNRAAVSQVIIIKSFNHKNPSSDNLILVQTNKTSFMKRIFLFRITAIVVLSVCSLCLRSEKIACKMNLFHNVKSAQLINCNIETSETRNEDGLLPYHPLIIKI